MKLRFTQKRLHGVREGGFSLLELSVVVAIAMVLVAMAVPQIIVAVNTFKLRNAGVEFAGIVQQARARSVKDSNHYSIYFNSTTNLTEAFIDIPKTGAIDTTNDPIVSWGPEISQQTAGNAPSTSALKTLFLSGYSTVATTYDASATTTSPVTFSPMGIPCYAASSGACTATGTPIAYWAFFKDSRSGQWEAVTVTPAGKIQKWFYSGSTWTLL